jgi:DNA-directed RNA polymerase subunit RPC12/RpoP
MGFVPNPTRSTASRIPLAWSGSSDSILDPINPDVRIRPAGRTEVDISIRGDTHAHHGGVSRLWQEIRADEKHAGRDLSCKQCGGSIPVPAQSPPSPSGPMVRFSCDQCGKPHVISAEHAGKNTVCAKCGAKIRIPGGSPSTASAKSAPAPAPSKPARVPVPAQQSPPAVDLDLYGWEEAPLASLPPRSAGDPSGASASDRSVSEDSLPAPSRVKAYKPLSEAKKKQIAKRAAKADRMKPSNATVGVSFGAVLAVALIGWRVYRTFNRFERAAARANAVQAATEEDFDPKAMLVEMDKDVEKMIAESSTAEARDWLDTTKHPNHGVMEMSIENAREMVAGFYQRGAEKVYILDPTTINNAVITAQIGVKLPRDSAQRKQCLEWAAKYEEEEKPSADRGQKYLLITTD